MMIVDYVPNKSNAPQPVLMNDHDLEPVLNTDLLHHHDHTTYLQQVDGNFSLSSSDSSDSSEPDQNMFNPDHNSTPVPDQNQFEPDHSPTPPTIPGLLDSLNSSSSLSLQSNADLDRFLPFSMTCDITCPSDQSSNPSSKLDLSLSQTQNPQPIPVVVGGHRLPHKNQPRTPNLLTVRRDNRAVIALSLPNIMVTNHRSIFPKFRNLVDELLENQMHVGIHSEIWEDRRKAAHANIIEENFEINGIEYISTPRPNRRGGGVAITLISDSPFVISKINIPTDPGSKPLETCWGLLRPKAPTGHIKSIIICAFYLPPYSKQKSALVEHISLTYFSLKAQHPESAFICGGDKNDLNIKLLLDIDPSFRQIVPHPTYKQSVLDVLVTDIGQYYEEPVIRDPVQPDNPVGASPSDHKIVFAKVKSNFTQPVRRVASIRHVRPLSDAAIAGFASWIQHESWEFVYNGADVSDMVERFNFIVKLNLDHYCPTKTVKTTNLDGKICCAAVRQASRRKNREYSKNGNSDKYKELKKKLKIKLREATTKFLAKQADLVSAKNMSWLKHVKNIAARPGDQPNKTFTLPKHVEENLSALESSNKICKFFSSISQEYSPLDPAALPNRVRDKLSNAPCKHPNLPDHIVYDALKKGKKTCSVPCDLPPRIVEEFLPELTAPIAAIYRQAIASHSWPEPFKKEYHLPISKVPIPQSEDDLRNLGLTAFFSKRLEYLLIQWIWPYIYPHIDLDQLGGIPGCSVNHYLIQMLDFIQRNLDNNVTRPTAVLTGLVEFSKAFNRIDHNIIVTILSDLNVPPCALRLVTSYLTGRRMCVRFNGAQSDDQYIPGGGPQGGLLTVILFDLQVNLAGNPCPLPCTLQPGEAGPDLGPLQAGPRPPCHMKERLLKKKFVDDLSLLEAIPLTLLVPAPSIIGPANLHEVPCLTLPPDSSALQHQLADLDLFTAENKMKINYKKTKILPFNFTKKSDFLPQLSFPGGEPLEVIYSTRLLGVIISSDLSWSNHVNDIVLRAVKKLWILIRFKSLGATTQQLLQVYFTRVRSTLEFAAPVFHGGLTKLQSNQLEMVQKKALAIILAQSYTNYETALLSLNMERLDIRREKLCLSFAIKCTKSHRHQSMFNLSPSPMCNTRNFKTYMEPLCHTSRYYNSSIPYLTRLLNKAEKK